MVLTVPKYVSEKKAEAYITEKEVWLRSVLDKTPKKATTHKEDRAGYLAHKERARVFVESRLVELNRQYGFVYKQVRIRLNKSRWGSCSASGNLNFDYRILFLPKCAQDYLLVHELCHLRELNHSKRFWALVSATVPEYKEVRKLLKRNTHFS